MKAPMKFYRNAYWLALPLLLNGSFSVLVVIESSLVATSGWIMASGLILMNVGLYFWSLNRYRSSSQAIEQNLYDSLQQQDNEKIKLLQDSQYEIALQACANRIEAERKLIESLLADLAQRFDGLSKTSRWAGSEKNGTSAFCRNTHYRISTA